MTARTIANRLLEADEDFNVHGELERLTTSGYPGYEIESEGIHWNVYKKMPGTAAPAAGPNEITFGTAGHDAFIGEITYDDMADMPKETMTPENIEYWNSHRWFASAGFRDNERQMCASFDEAVKWIIAVNTVKTSRVRESEDPDDPSANIERFATERSTPVEMRFINHNGRPFRVRLVWDKPAGGTAYDSKGKVVPEKLQPTVEFYDMTRAKDPKIANSSFKDYGQYVSSYYAATLMDHPMHVGLDLYGGERLWVIDGDSMDTVLAWIKEQVESRGYKLVDDSAGGISFGKRYEALDPDDPELYIKPEKFTGQPTYEKMESDLRIMLRPYYDDVRIHRRPHKFATVFKGLPEYFTWTVHCKRRVPLQLPKTRPFVGHKGQDPNSWRIQVEKWFEDWAEKCGVRMDKFEIYGRLRIDPTFQFDTHLPWKTGVHLRSGTPLKENEEDLQPEDYVSHIVDTSEASNELSSDLWRFHPYGVGYTALLSYRGGFVSVQTYFPPEKDNFIMRFQDFVLNWVKEHKVMTVTHHKLTTWQMDRDKNYPRWGVMLALNSDWPPDQAAYVPPPVEVGQP